MIKFFSFLMIGLGLAVHPAHAQPADGGDIHKLQDSLVKLGYVMYNEPSEPDRLQANFLFVKTLVSALQIPHSYDFRFDSLDMVSLLRSPDDAFRIFTWHLPLNDGSYLYYGTIQLNTPDGRLRMFPLLDRTYEVADPETAITTAQNWYGAQYYRIIPFNGDYLLLGWKGHTPQVTQKVIEILRFEGDSVQLGKSIFSSDKTTSHTRMIYRYNRQTSMHMDYDTAGQRIVMDHLAPADARQAGHYEQYGPDLSYDAWKLEGNRLILVPDVEFTNAPDENDALYNDPTKPSTHPKSGFSQQ